jgi:geranylgeranyl diphosphate synthase type II
MEPLIRIDRALEAALARAAGRSCPPGLAAALRHAVFPGGARLRPRLCLAVARACGEDEPALGDAAAAAVELLHCASLVHDDLPCFDDAATRRGRASVHRAFGERLAVLAGDALIVLAFETLAAGATRRPERLAPLVAAVGAAVGAPAGIAAGQAWECEPRLDRAEYHRQKTGALFAGAAMLGALAAGAEPEPWRVLGERLGLAYQVADDVRDVAADPAELGKPIGRDAALARPSAVGELGLEGALARLRELVAAAVAAIPPCPGADDLAALVEHETRRFLPVGLVRAAA